MKVKVDFLQKYIQEHIHLVDTMPHHLLRYYYEVTVTFDPSYWSISQSLNAIPQVIADILKPIVKSNYQFATFHIAYCVEYHNNGYPHVHAQILNTFALDPEDQRKITQRLCRRYGRSQWYQTGTEDKIHKNDKYPDGIKWSDYIQKDAILNAENGQCHYFQYQIGGLSPRLRPPEQ